jgi:drug/metabolite transporter (DMT)-like permease
MSQLQSQILGTALAVTTAVGCLFYGKLVKNFSLGIIALLAVVFYVPLLVGTIFYSKVTFTSDIIKLISNKTFLVYALVYVLTWATVPLWFIITKHQGVLVGSIYEVKYIVILTIFYILWGDRSITVYTALGVICALLSIYFISK